MKEQPRITWIIILLVVASLVLAPVAAVEYFILFWFWAGDGLFMLLSVPGFFAVFFMAQLYLLMKYKKSQRIKILLIFSMVFATPVLAVCGSYLLAWICGIQVVIW